MRGLCSFVSIEGDGSGYPPNLGWGLHIYLCFCVAVENLRWFMMKISVPCTVYHRKKSFKPSCSFWNVFFFPQKPTNLEVHLRKQPRPNQKKHSHQTTEMFRTEFPPEKGGGGEQLRQPQYGCGWLWGGMSYSTWRMGHYLVVRITPITNAIYVIWKGNNFRSWRLTITMVATYLLTRMV